MSDIMRVLWLILQHSRDCGSGTAVFLIVNSSLILIVRGPRAVVWGSVYLDAHSEEDRELRYVERRDAACLPQPRSLDVQHLSYTFELSLSCARLVADG